MHQRLVSFVQDSINEAATFVTKFMPIGVETDDAYETLLSCSQIYSVEMQNAFAAAVKYLPPKGRYKDYPIVLPNGKRASIQTYFAPTKKWPQLLLPAGDISLTPESKLHELLKLPIRVAQEWAMLRYAWSKVVADNRMNVKIIGHFFPWVRDIVCDYPWQYISNDKTQSNYVTANDRDIMKREIATIMRAEVPNFFPSKTPELTAVMRSGRTFMAQYHMLKAAYAEPNNTRACLVVEVTESLIPDWLPVAITDMFTQWEQDKRDHAIRAFDNRAIALAREADKKF